MKSSSLVVLLAAAVVALAAPQVGAQSSSNEWQYAIAPYLWAAGMDGTATIAANEADVDVEFSDIIDNLDFAFMGHFDMRNDTWVLSSDLTFVDLGHSEDVQGEFAEGTLKAGMDMTLLEVAGGYRVSPAVALLVGARWVDMSTSLRYSGEMVGDEVEASKSWVDPLVGVHVFAPMSERWWFGLRADVGGFGVGSELTWQAYADIGFKASDLVTLILGYHVIDMDYEDGQDLHYFGLDIAMSGPQLGVVFTF